MIGSVLNIIQQVSSFKTAGKYSMSLFFMPLILVLYLVTVKFGILLDFRQFICLLRSLFLSVIIISCTIRCISKLENREVFFFKSLVIALTKLR